MSANLSTTWAINRFILTINPFSAILNISPLRPFLFCTPDSPREFLYSQRRV